jgi:hypothetical protein
MAVAVVALTNGAPTMERSGAGSRVLSLAWVAWSAPKCTVLTACAVDKSGARINRVDLPLVKQAHCSFASVDGEPQADCAHVSRPVR